MKLVHGIWLALFAVLIFPASVLGAEKPAKMTADTVYYDYDNKRVVADGNAVLDYRDIHLSADYIEIDLNENSLIARGHVQLVDKERTVEGEMVIYDLDSRVGAINDMSGRFTDPSITGPVFVESEAATVGEDSYILRNASLTTCDLENPHFHLEAEEIEVYLNDKIVLRRVRYYEGRLRLFSLPYLVISLREDGLGMQVPQIGYSGSEGVFVKASYGYVINENHSGTIRLDMMQQIGMAAGVEHRVRIGENFVGSVGVFPTLNGSNTHIDWRLTASAEQKIGDLKFNLNGILFHGAEPSPPPNVPAVDYNEYAVKASVNGRSSAGVTAVSAEYRYDEGYSLNTRETLFSASGNTNLKWENGFSLSVVGSYRYRDLPGSTTTGQSETRAANYTIRAAQDWGWGTLSLSVQDNTYLDPLHPEQQSSLRAELGMLFPKVEVPILGPFRANVGVGRLSQGLTVESQMIGYRGFAEIERQALSLTSGGFNLALSGKVRGSYTIPEDPGEWLGWLPTPMLTEVATLAWNQRYWPWLRTTAAFSWTAVQGDTPFTIEKPTPGGSVTGGIYVEHNVIQASLTTGYDFLTSRYRDFVGRLRVNVSEGDYLQLYGSYNPTPSPPLNPTEPLRYFGSYVFEGNISNEKSHFKARVLMDPNQLDPALHGWEFRQFLGRTVLLPQVFRQVNLDSSVVLFGNWTLEGKVNFDLSFSTDIFDALNQASLSVGYDWHCRVVKFSYDFINNSFNFSFLFKAFPGKPLAFGSSF